MVICEPPTVVSDTPLIDALEASWPPELFHQGDYYEPGNETGPRCVLKALDLMGNTLTGILTTLVYKQAHRTVVQINDDDGRDAVLAALRNAERELHGHL